MRERAHKIRVRSTSHALGELRQAGEEEKGRFPHFRKFDTGSGIFRRTPPAGTVSCPSNS